MKQLLFFFFMFCFTFSASAKKYRFEIKQEYRVEQIRVAQDESRFVKTWGEGNNADKAIDQALQNAVACCIFMGINAVNNTTGHNANAVPPLCPNGIQAYWNNQKYFDNFFKSGDFLFYVNNSNSRYPSGENNVKIKGGRRVCIYAQLRVKELRQRLEQDGIIKSFENIWDKTE